ncbi:hypothetical protein JYB64_05890 [Algoriphagus aestuarii]|nr:hypothetical protein [Algoriphagus aestuarii]
MNGIKSKDNNNISYEKLGNGPGLVIGADHWPIKICTIPLQKSFRRILQCTTMTGEIGKENWIKLQLSRNP